MNLFIQNTDRFKRGMVNIGGTTIVRPYFKACHHAKRCREQYGNVDDMCKGMRCLFRYRTGENVECPCVVVSDPNTSEGRIGMLGSSFKMPDILDQAT